MIDVRVANPPEFLPSHCCSMHYLTMTLVLMSLLSVRRCVMANRARPMHVHSLRLCDTAGCLFSRLIVIRIMRSTFRRIIEAIFPSDMLDGRTRSEVPLLWARRRWERPTTGFVSNMKRCAATVSGFYLYGQINVDLQWL